MTTFYTASAGTVFSQFELNNLIVCHSFCIGKKVFLQVRGRTESNNETKSRDKQNVGEN